MPIARSVHSLVVLLAAAGLSLGLAVQPADHRPPPVDPELDTPTLPQRCQEIKKLIDASAALQKDADVRLSSLVTSMNEAAGPARVDAMAAVINELITQRAAARDRWTRLDAATKEHIMQHMIDAASAETSTRLKQGSEGCAIMHPPEDKAR